MAVKIRLARGGAKKRPYYNIVVADVRTARDGRFIEKIGTYNPLLDQDHADRITFKDDRAKYWISVGAQPTDRVSKLLALKEIIAMPMQTNKPKKSQPKAKAQERMKAEALAKEEAAAKATEAAS